MKRILNVLNGVDLSRIFADLPHPVMILKADAPAFTILYANPCYEQLLGVALDDIVGKDLLEAFPNNAVTEAELQERDARNKMLERVQYEGMPQSTHRARYDLPDAQGVLRPRYWQVFNAPVRDDEGRVVAISSCPIDVTAEVLAGETAAIEKQRREEMEARAAESSEQSDYLQQVIDMSQTGIFVFTPASFGADGRVADFRFKLANRQLASYIGRTGGEVRGGLGSVFFPDYLTNGLFEIYRHTWETGENRQFEFHYFGSGIDVWLDIKSLRLPDGDVLVTFSDHTAQRQMAHTLEQTVQELRRSNDYLESFAYVASHDMQEPLRKIQAFSQLLQTRYGTELSDGAVNLINRIHAGTDRMRGLIDDLLLYSRMSARPRELRPVDLGKILDDVRTDMEATIREQHAQIVSAGLRTVPGDEGQLRHLFQNLVSNAIKFSRAGVVPVVRISGETMPASSGVPMLRVSIADNGQGFDQQYAERIFGMFQRLHGRSEAPGTGIGLSIVQKVAENHGGRVEAFGKPGEGAEFVVWLPVGSS